MENTFHQHYWQIVKVLSTFVTGAALLLSRVVRHMISLTVNFGSERDQWPCKIKMARTV